MFFEGTRGKKGDGWKGSEREGCSARSNESETRNSLVRWTGSIDRTLEFD